MREQLEQRLNDLKKEFDAGHKTLAELEAKQLNLKSTLMRISGAIQVLEEELDKVNRQANESDHVTSLKPSKIKDSAGEANIN